jgi:succinate-semialdehyde dehydrogenase/glutarate-semialdehyde dehydrogenase
MPELALATPNLENSTVEALSPRVGPGRLRQLAALVTTIERRETVEIRSPLHGRTIGEVPVTTPADVQEAVRRARRAQQEWAHRSIAERAEIFIRFHDLIIERQEEILDLIQLESGKTRKHAFEEVADTAIVARYYAHHAEKHLAPKRRQGALPGLTVTWEHHHPVGVVGIIAPWNYPLSMAITDAIPALIAGNAVVLKPDQKTPFTALWVVGLLREAGLPADLYQAVTGEGTELGTPLIEASDALHFTGSTATGRKVARQAAERLIHCSLELGGKNAMVLLADADLEAAVAGAIRGCFSSAGQLCISIERLFIHETLYHRFVERFVEETKALRLGIGLDWEADMGSLISADHLAKVEGHVRDAVEKGATILAGGKARPDLGPCFFEPTILAGVTEEMTLFAEETFGPVVALYSFESINDVVERVNASHYGLNASVWTRDLDLGHRVGMRLQCGWVIVIESFWE